MHLEDPLSSDASARADEVVADTDAGIGTFERCDFGLNRALQGAAVYTATFATALSAEALADRDNRFNFTLSAGQALLAGSGWSPGATIPNAITLPHARAGAAAQVDACLPLQLQSQESLTAAVMSSKAEVHGVPFDAGPSGSNMPHAAPIDALAASLRGEVLQTTQPVASSASANGSDVSFTSPPFIWNSDRLSPVAAELGTGAYAQVGSAAPGGGSMGRTIAPGALRLADTNGTLAPPALLWSLQAVHCTGTPSDDLSCFD